MREHLTLTRRDDPHELKRLIGGATPGRIDREQTLNGGYARTIRVSRSPRIDGDWGGRAVLFFKRWRNRRRKGTAASHGRHIDLLGKA